VADLTSGHHYADTPGVLIVGQNDDFVISTNEADAGDDQTTGQRNRPGQDDVCTTYPHQVRNDSQMTPGASHRRANGDGAPWRRTRWIAALILTVGGLVVNAYWLFTNVHPVCQVTTAASGAVTKSCGLPDITDYIYLLAVLAVLLLPEAKSIKIGGLEFERLTTAVREQKEEVARLTQRVSQAVNTTQSINQFFGAAEVAEAATTGDVAEGARPAEEVLRELFPDPDST